MQTHPSGGKAQQQKHFTMLLWNCFVFFHFQGLIAITMIYSTLKLHFNVWFKLVFIEEHDQDNTKRSTNNNLHANGRHQFNFFLFFFSLFFSPFSSFSYLFNAWKWVLKKMQELQEIWILTGWDIVHAKIICFSCACYPWPVKLSFILTMSCKNGAELTVVIFNSTEQRCNLPPFKHGAVVCRKDMEQRELCNFQCQGGYVVNPVSIFSRPFDCHDGGEDFSKLSSLMKKQDACLSTCSLYHDHWRLLV